MFVLTKQEGRLTEKEIQSKGKNSKGEKEGRGGDVCKHINIHRAFRMSWAQWRSPLTPSHNNNPPALGREMCLALQTLGRSECQGGAAPPSCAAGASVMAREESEEQAGRRWGELGEVDEVLL